MPWYKFYANHGPGHQGHSEEYKYFTEPIRGDERKERWLEWCRDWDDSIGGVKPVHRVPEDEVVRLRAMYKGRISNARLMLEVLDAVDTYQPRQKPSWECRFCTKRWTCRVTKKHLVRNCSKRVAGRPVKPGRRKRCRKES